MIEDGTSAVNKFVKRDSVMHVCTFCEHGVGRRSRKVHLLHSLSGIEDELNPQQINSAVTDKVDRHSVTQPDNPRE